MGLKERLEIQMYKAISLIPVSCTMFLYVYLFVFYTYVSPTPIFDTVRHPLTQAITFLFILKLHTLTCFYQFYLHPTITMDFSHIGFDKLWEDETQMRADAKMATS
jgi:hypothetical protein